MTFSEKLFKLRCQNRLTAEELAEKLEVQSQDICDWEEGIAFPGIEEIARLSDIFLVSTDYLIKNDAVYEDGCSFTERNNGGIAHKNYFSQYTVSLALAIIGSFLIVIGLILMAFSYDPTILFFAGVPAATVGLIFGFVKKSPLFKALWAVWIIVFVYFAIFLPDSLNIIEQIVTRKVSANTIFSLIIQLGGLALFAELIRRIVVKKLKK